MPTASPAEPKVSLPVGPSDLLADSNSMLYYTSIILLHRPFYAIPAHHAACRKASDSIEKLVLLLEKTFGLTKVPYLMAYCIYTAASVMMQDVKSGDIEANIKMQTFLHALRQGIVTCPMVQRSLDIITDGLRSDNTTILPARSSNATAADGMNGMSGRNYLAAFPYRGLDVETAMNPSMGTMDLDGFSLLDCFPENHFDNMNSAGEWFLPTC